MRCLRQCALLLFFLECSVPGLPESLAADSTDHQSVPRWAKAAVWYQIFPERFANGDPTNDPTAEDVAGAWPHRRPENWHVSPWTSDWYKLQPWEQTGNGFYYHAQQRRYGGDLQGVLDRLEYLTDLGITAIYFNPLFEAPSLHKYDAAQYHHIDNNFGPDPDGDRRLWSTENPADPATWHWTAADRLFLSLVREAHRRGIRVILDGVFNHVGTHFWAFEDVRKNGLRSAYKEWFIVTAWDDPATPADEFNYRGWMNVQDLPEFREDSSGLVHGPREHVKAVVSRWMDPNGDGDPADGIDGWRLDVAEMVALPFWREFRTWVRTINPDAYITGEVWWEDWARDSMFNASPWLRGDVFDAVMNYRVAREACRFFKDRQNKITASEFDRRLRRLRADYRDDVNQVLMNLYGSHDTDRLASMIVNVDTRFDHQVSVKDDPAYLVRKPTAAERRIQRLMVVFQMTYLGAPMVYYGDEAGMWGGDDPDERKPMVWPDSVYEDETHHPLGKSRPADRNSFDSSLAQSYRTLISIRREHPALQFGTIETLHADDARDLYAFVRAYGDEQIIVVLNNSDTAQRVDLQPPGSTGVASWRNLLATGTPVSGTSGIRVTLGPRSAAILKGSRR